MKISTLETDKCLAVEGKGGTVVLKPCSDESTALNWAYTLTGSIMVCAANLNFLVMPMDDDTEACI